jgi:transketolase
MPTFGASAPLKQLVVRFGFTPDRVVEVARDRLTAAREERSAKETEHGD